MLKEFLDTFLLSDGVLCENKRRHISTYTKYQSNLVSEEEKEEEEEGEEALVEQINLGLNQT